VSVGFFNQQSTINYQQYNAMARILIIDDDAEFLKMFRQMLERAGHDVIDAPNGEAGLKLFRQDRTQLVITDIFMPEKEGIETILELKREFPTVKIIAISGGGRKEEYSYLDSVKDLGADRSFTKPFERQEMLETIEELLD
jgi:DNA-binding response OmpR family regulator